MLIPEEPKTELAAGGKVDWEGAKGVGLEETPNGEGEGVEGAVPKNGEGAAAAAGVEPKMEVADPPLGAPTEELLSPNTNIPLGAVSGAGGVI